MNALRSFAFISTAVLLAGILSACGGAGAGDLEGDAADPMTLFDTAVDRFERAPLSHLPTAFEEMAALSAELGGPRLFVKRDDQTGLAFGGNKARKLDFILADAVAKGSDTVITWAGVQSNWARMTAAGSRRLGMNPILVLQRREGQSVAPEDGNLLLDRILGADVRIVEPDGDREATVAEIAAAEREAGRNPYVVSVGGSRTGGGMVLPLGSVAYANGFRELLGQARDAGLTLTHVVHASGSGSTQAGLVVGAKMLAPEVEIIGISSGGSKAAGEANVLAIARETVEAMGLDLEIEPADVVVHDEYVGEGYGILNQRVVETVAQVARTEGILLDPVYTGKAMTGLLNLVKNSHFSDTDVVVFLHTGGTPALFPYREGLLKDLPVPTEE
jgi:D-cysteine desulfhydrase family pyridoxal phosphate-dependent enzyme